MSTHTQSKKITISTLERYKSVGEKFASIAVYDAGFAEIADSAGIEVLLVGDSLGMVLQGHDSTLPVTMEDIVYHLEMVGRGAKNALLMGDLPFMSYHSEGQSLENAAALMRAGAHMVKLEGGEWIAESTKLLVERGIPVCAHMGLTPQSINRFGGFRVQGRDPAQAQTIIDEATMLEDSGASILLLECVPLSLAKTITERLRIPVIGIGAGPHTDGQIMVMHDMLGITPPDIKVPKFVKNFLVETDNDIRDAFVRYRAAIIAGAFPDLAHSYE
jgi:3-methyl-2-oxobutanoate hydroxymethyltransferase